VPKHPSDGRLFKAKSALTRAGGWGRLAARPRNVAPKRSIQKSHKVAVKLQLSSSLVGIFLLSAAMGERTCSSLRASRLLRPKPSYPKSSDLLPHFSNYLVAGAIP